MVTRSVSEATRCGRFPRLRFGLPCPASCVQSGAVLLVAKRRYAIAWDLEPQGGSRIPQSESRSDGMGGVFLSGRDLRSGPVGWLRGCERQHVPSLSDSLILTRVRTWGLKSQAITCRRFATSRVRRRLDLLRLVLPPCRTPALARVACGRAPSRNCQENFTQPAIFNAGRQRERVLGRDSSVITHIASIR